MVLSKNQDKQGGFHKIFLSWNMHKVLRKVQADCQEGGFRAV